MTQAGGCSRPTTEVEATVAPDGATVALTSTSSGSFQVHALSLREPLPVTAFSPATCLTCGDRLGIGSAGHPAWAPGLP